MGVGSVPAKCCVKPRTSLQLSHAVRHVRVGVVMERQYGGSLPAVPPTLCREGPAVLPAAAGFPAASIRIAAVRLRMEKATGSLEGTPFSVRGLVAFHAGPGPLARVDQGPTDRPRQHMLPAGRRRRVRFWRDMHKQRLNDFLAVAALIASADECQLRLINAPDMLAAVVPVDAAQAVLPYLAGAVAELRCADTLQRAHLDALRPPAEEAALDSDETVETDASRRRPQRARRVIKSVKHTQWHVRDVQRQKGIACAGFELCR